MRVFWPTDIAKSDLPGVIVGWRNSGLDVVVVAVLDHVDVSIPPAPTVGSVQCLTTAVYSLETLRMR
jgi:hypothetical protein